jgi:DNA-directed RNA polymerase specialized sigma24 family protein
MTTMKLTPEVREAADRWCKDFYARLHLDAVRLTGDDEFLADDLVQDTLLKGSQRYDQLRDRDRELPWLRAILRRVYLNWKERGQKAIHLPEEYDPEDSDAKADDDSDGWHAPASLARLFRDLPEVHCQTLDALVAGGLSQRRGAALLGIGESAFFGRMKRFARWRIGRGIGEAEMFRAIVALRDFGWGASFSNLCHLAILEVRFDLCVGSLVTSEMHRHSLRAEECWDGDIEWSCDQAIGGRNVMRSWWDSPHRALVQHLACYLRRQRDRPWAERLQSAPFRLLCDLKPEWAASALGFAATVADEAGAAAVRELLLARCRELRGPSWDGLIIESFIDHATRAGFGRPFAGAPLFPLFNALLQAYQGAGMHDRAHRLFSNAHFGETPDKEPVPVPIITVGPPDQ